MAPPQAELFCKLVSATPGATQAIRWLEREDQVLAPNLRTDHYLQRYKCRGQSETGSFRRIAAFLHSADAIGPRVTISSQDHFSTFGP
jgi:hypothetical protein